MKEDLTDHRVIKWEKAAEKPMIIISLLFLVVLILPSAHPLTPTWRSHLNRLDLTIWVIFAVDYFGKLVVSKYRRQFFKTHLFEMLIVILPFLRPLRLLRLIPLVGYFLRYAKRTLSGKLLQYVSLAAILITTPAAILMYEVERDASGSNIKTLGDAIWWADATITTVGYGDRFPITALGRSLAFLVMITGISLIGVITASIASWFVKSDEEASDQVQMHQLMSELKEIKSKLEKLEG